MKVEQLSSGHRRAIIFFAGWGMAPNAFAALSHPGYDIHFVYDYNSPEIEADRFADYEEICILAWSMGVPYADAFAKTNRQLPITKMVAVNSSLAPISDTLGIPEKIYEATCELPDERAVEKFYRRIAGGTAALARLLPIRPNRELTSLRDELVDIKQFVETERDIDASEWDTVVLSTADLIFPYDNMVEAWMQISERVETLEGAAHMIDFNELMARMFVDKELVEKNFAGAMTSTYDANAAVQQTVAKTLAEKACEAIKMLGSGSEVVEVGSGAGMLTKLYIPMLSRCRVVTLDLTGECRGLPKSDNEVIHRQCDAEIEIRHIADASVDLLLSSSTIQWFNSPVKFIKEVRRVLKPGGRAFISCYAKGTFANISDIASLSYPQLRADATERATIEMHFPSAVDALRHIKLTGVNSLRRKPLSPMRMREVLRELTNDDGTATLTFAVSYLEVRG